MDACAENLFADIDARQTTTDSGFLQWFQHSWSQRNSLQNLSAPISKIKLGALLEWEYINRGASEDRRKYCDVILGPHCGEVSNLVVDVKYVGIKSGSNRDAAFNTVLQRHQAKRGWYSSLNINELHFWSHSAGSRTIKPWFRWVVQTGEVIKM